MKERQGGPSVSPAGDLPGLDPEGWLDRHGDAMFRFAMLRLRDAEVASEVVQEAFLHAFRSRASYSGRASERTWLVAILRNKIVDHFRRSAREPSTHSEDLGDDPCFDGRGHWRAMPARWTGQPSEDLEREEFWSSFTACLSRLPSNVADAFLLREVEDLGPDDVCELLRITPVNLHTRLYRARMVLRECLERNWFKGVEGDQEGRSMTDRLRDLAGRANPSCRSAMGTVSESLDRPLNRFERLAIAAHMLHCPPCRRGRHQITLMIDALRNAARLHGNGWLPGLPAEVRERIRRALRDQ